MRQSPIDLALAESARALAVEGARGRLWTEFAREMKLAAAIHWYRHGQMSQERAAELAGLNRRDFLHALARAGVEVFPVDEEALARELADAG